MTLTRKLKKRLEYERGLYEVWAHEAFFDVLRKNEFVHADLVADECFRRDIPPKEARRLLPALFRLYRKDLLIVKIDKFILSKRSSKPIRVYKSMRFGEAPRGAQGALVKGKQISLVK
jgi:hypothetical protein